MKNRDLVYNYRKVIVLAIACAIVIVIAIAGFSMSWFTTERELDMMTMIKTPIVLKLRSGNDHDIVYLDMGNIDVESGEYSKSYVFCVYGEPIDYYSLQLAHTTNIDFKYKVYRADYVENGSYDEGDTIFTFIDENNVLQTEHFRQTSVDGHPLPPIINTDVENLEVHKKPGITYKSENTEFVTDGIYQQVQSNAQPLYWLAQENGLTSMSPINTVGSGFYDYYILTVSWDENVKNNKETDMVYISVSF